MSAPRVSIHPAAIVEDPDALGDGCRVGPFSHVVRGAVVGPCCVLGQGVHVAKGARIGRGVRVQNGVSIYDGVELGDEVFVGPSAVFTNVRAPRAAVSRRAYFERTRVLRGATIGANATLLPGVTFGRHAFAGAGAVVTGDVPDYALVVGAPARLAGYVSRHGQRLALDRVGDVAACPESGLRYVLGEGGVRGLDLGEDEPLPGAGPDGRVVAAMPCLRRAKPGKRGGKGQGPRGEGGA